MYILAASDNRRAIYATVLNEEEVAEIAENAPSVVYFFAEIEEKTEPEVLAEGIFCTTCEYFEEKEFFDDGARGVHCRGCGCPESNHVPATLIRGEVPDE